MGMKLFLKYAGKQTEGLNNTTLANSLSGTRVFREGVRSYTLHYHFQDLRFTRPYFIVK